MNKPTEINHTTDKPGLVISYFGNSVAVEDSAGQVFQCHLKRNQELPVVGDRVIWQLEKGDTGIILKIEPRRSLLSRGEGHGKVKAIAANIDAIVVVMSPPPIFTEYLVDRYLVAAELLNIPAILVLNKSDLLDEKAKVETLARLAPYQAMQYPVILSSIYNDGLVSLAAALQNKCAVLVGPSGVGKSSIISALRGEAAGDAIVVGAVTDKGIGRHTTTATRLYHLANNTTLIDSPGVREFNLWSVTKQEVMKGFREFLPYQQGCKFRDCAHVKEPGCKVQEAILAGKISPERFANYQTLLKLADTKQYP